MQLKYGIEDRPGLLELMLFGLQWLAVSIPSIIIIGKVIAGLNNSAGEVFYLQKLFMIVGIVLLIQIFWGHRLPLVLGPATVLLIGLLASLDRSQGAINSAMLLGGLALTFLAATGLFAHIKRFFTPRVVVVIMMLIAFTIAPTIIDLITTSGEINGNLNLMFGLILFVMLVAGNRLLSGLWGNTLVLWAILLGSVVYYLVFPVSPQSLSSFALGAWPTFLPFDLAIPDLGLVLAFLICFIALSMNELSSIQSVGIMLNADNMEKRVNRGVSVIGFGNILAALGGVIGPVDFSLGPGVIATTKCASRFTLIPTGIALLLLACSPIAIALVGAVPSSVIGVILAYIITSQIGAALLLIHQTQSATSFDDGLVIGLPLMLGTIVAFLPPEIVTQFPDIIRPVAANGFVAGTIAVLLLEHLVYRQDTVPAKIKTG
ncbi:MAG: purine/pyrimidine permease [Syntrophomonadaceae bacterium]|nr:purine/pyrimidine permease [Syntrophomonadaceae bacterium]